MADVADGIIGLTQAATLSHVYFSVVAALVILLYSFVFLAWLRRKMQKLTQAMYMFDVDFQFDTERSGQQ